MYAENAGTNIFSACQKGDYQYVPGNTIPKENE